MTIDEIYLLCKQAGVITTDSRACPDGSVFVALRGETFDGNQFAVAALEHSAYAIVDADPQELDPSGVYHARLIRVADTLQTYKALAHRHRSEYHIPVLAITGTNGKTTTKELTAAVLATTYHPLATQGNYNNDVGVPKTLLALAAHDCAVIEMGASHRGDIATLAATAAPTCGLITNIGRAHLQGFGSLAGVRATKGELYEYLAQHGGFAFINPDDASLVALARDCHLPTVAYPRATLVAADPYLSVALDSGSTIHTQLVGAYNITNLLAAVAVGRHFGVPEEKIVAALEGYRPRNSRSQWLTTAHNELIVDAYNANPSSMAAAIDNFAQMTVRGKKMLILGEMAELGAASGEEHIVLVRQLKGAGFADVWLVGRAFLSVPSPFTCFATVDEVKEEIARAQPQNRCILIKGSHAVHLESIVELL